ncbi:MAG TPA: IS110 family transposase [Chloroflexota bacterium]|nr:IS110 family transposase [Chloroflexota bacterium]
MEVLHERCAGLDVHKNMVVGCVRLARGGRVEKEVKTFKTTTGELLALADWLDGHGVNHVVMEATGVYWKPVWHVLDDGERQLVLANAAHVKNVPGRKSDVSDCDWLSDLEAHGLVRASFVPDQPTQELRSLLRTRKQLVRERTSHTLRLQKTLEDANIKLDSVISNVVGVSGRRMVEALVAGESDPAALASLADRRIKAPPEVLCEALRGRVTRHHRFLLGLHLGHIDAIDEAVDRIDQEVEASLQPFCAAVDLLKTIPGVSQLAAEGIVAEIGLDMSRFPTCGHLISWAGLCPRSDESAGKRRSTRIGKGNPWLKTLLVQGAWAATKTKATYLHAQFLSVRSRRGARKAIVAVAASILTAAYHMLKNGTPYRDLGPQHLDRRNKEAQARRLLTRLRNLGFAADFDALRQAPVSC